MPDNETTIILAAGHCDDAAAHLRAGHWGRAYHHACRAVRWLDDLGITTGDLRARADGLAEAALAREPKRQPALPMAA